MAREFTQVDIVDHGDGYRRIYADASELVYAPLPWQRAGLQQTTSGYGAS